MSDRYPDFLGGLYVDNQLEFARSLDRQICRFCAMENLADQWAQRTIRVEQIGPIGDQPAGAREIGKQSYRRKLMAQR